MAINKQRNLVSKHIRNGARGELCSFMFTHGVCECSRETTVFCHLKSGTHGMGLKGTDLIGAYGCRSCHDFIDGRMKNYYDENGIYLVKLNGLRETHRVLMKKKIIFYSDLACEALDSIYDKQEGLSKELYFEYVNKIIELYNKGDITVKGDKR
ncbi:nuclease domain-containing protein [Neisseria sp. Ec49-e6-T10]|uniref:nuclease domain-containing protein n=1 Tax=Neisseria sp. Ec49-e6-T10 TaxID=3140744 RepID=UPI003EC14E73